MVDAAPFSCPPVQYSHFSLCGIPSIPELEFRGNPMELSPTLICNTRETDYLLGIEQTVKSYNIYLESPRSKEAIIFLAGTHVP
jgi:hypothetical protein